MDDLIKVEENSNLRRDSRSNAIINLDTESYQRYLTERQARLDKKMQDEERINSRIASVENSVEEIKNMLQKLLEVRNDN